MLTVLLYFGVNYDEKCGSPFMPQNKKKKTFYLTILTFFLPIMSLFVTILTFSLFIYYYFFNFKYKIKIILYMLKCNI